MRYDEYMPIVGISQPFRISPDSRYSPFLWGRGPTSVTPSTHLLSSGIGVDVLPYRPDLGDSYG